MESCQISPEQEKSKKQDFFPVNQIQVIHRKTFHALPVLPVEKEQTSCPAEYRYADAGCRIKPHDLHRGQKPGDKTGDGHRQYF